MYKYTELNSIVTYNFKKSLYFFQDNFINIQGVSDYQKCYIKISSFCMKRIHTNVSSLFKLEYVADMCIHISNVSEYVPYTMTHRFLKMIHCGAMFVFMWPYVIF